VSCIHLWRAWPVAALVGALTLFSACGSAAPDSRTASAVAPPGQSGVTGGSSAKLGTEALDNLIPATGAQFTAGARFSGTMRALENTINAQCMAYFGFHIPTTSASAFAAQFVDPSQFPDLAVMSRTGRLGPAVSLPAGPQLPPAERQAYQADMPRCTAAARQPFIPLLASTSNLVMQWFDVVTKIESSAQVQAGLGGFRSCVEGEGVPASAVDSPSSAESFGGFLAWETGLETRAKTQAAVSAVDRHWAPIFVRCARATVAIQERMQSAQRAAFLQDHPEQVHGLEATAGQVVAQLERQYGTAGTG
jgi:hypothetical protein